MSIKMEMERQPLFINASKSSNMLERLQSDLLLPSQSKQDLKLYFDLSKNINLLSQIKVSKNLVVLRAFLARRNGSLIKLPVQYAQFFQKAMKPTQKNIDFHYSRSQEVIKIKITSPKKIDTEYPAYNIIQITNSIKSCIEHLKNVLSKIGIIKQFNGTTLKTKKAQIALQEKIGKILFQSNLKNKQKQAGVIQNSKNGLFKSCLLMKEIPDPPEYLLNPENTSESTKTANFIIERKLFEISHSNMQSQIKQLAVKKINSTKIQNKAMLKQKIMDEKFIISKIPKSEYFLNYWIEENHSNEKIYMDFVSNTLSDLVYYRSNSISDILDFSNQLIKGVSLLHQSGVIHRDLKPHNILVEETSKSEYRLKIIDFGESTHISNSAKQTTTAMGYTLPYSPFQCAYPGPKGLFSNQIDYWSVGVLIYQMAFRYNPILFHRPFSENVAKITKGIKIRDDFQVIGMNRKGQGLRIVQFVLNLLTLHSVCIDPQERINFQQMKDIISSCQQFLKNISDF